MIIDDESRLTAFSAGRVCGADSSHARAGFHGPGQSFRDCPRLEPFPSGRRPVKTVFSILFAGLDQKMASGHRRLDIEEVGDVTIAKFIDKKILDEGNIQVIGNQLFGLVEDDNRKKIILDFSNVEYLSSAALGKLITMDKKVKAAKGKLRLCSVRPDIYEVFAITKLNKLFDMRETQEQALEGM